MVMPRSRSRSILSRYCARMLRSLTAWVRSSRRSARVDLPWSMWAMMQKLRRRASSVGMAGPHTIGCASLARFPVNSSGVCSLANIRSQIKRNRQNEQARLRNKSVRTALKTYARRVRESLDAGDQDAAESALRRATRAYDRAASKGVIHKNNAANHKARLARSVNQQGQ